MDSQVSYLLSHKSMLKLFSYIAQIVQALAIVLYTQRLTDIHRIGRRETHVHIHKKNHKYTHTQLPF